MLDYKDVQSKTCAVQRGLHTKLGVRGRDLSQVLRRAGRRLPSRVRRQGHSLARAEFLAKNPKIAAQIDPAQIQSAYDAVTRHLASIDVGKNRLDRWLGVAGTIAFNLLIIATVFVFFLWWRGYV